MLHYDFRRFLDELGKLNPAQIEDAQTKFLDLRRKSETILEIEARTNQEHKYPFCGPATKNLNGYIRWMEMRQAGGRPADIVRAA